jgi:pristinamycin I synthase-2
MSKMIDAERPRFPLGDESNSRADSADTIEPESAHGEREALPAKPSTQRTQAGDFDPETATLPILFAAQVAARPQQIALSFGASRLSYAELDARAERLADRLVAADIGPGSIVGLCLPRSIELIVALLAVLKSGAAYLPLDPAYPGDRLAYMVEDADAALVIAACEDVDWLAPERRRLDPSSGEDMDRGSQASARRTAGPDDLAYVIYTSGSTGKPKGVAVEHAQVVRLFSATQHWFDFQPSDVWTLFHSVSFDFSVWEIWGALFYGGRLAIVPDAATRDPASFLRLLADEKVTVLNQTPSAFGALDRADGDRAGRDPLALRLVIFGGEALDPRRLAGWYRRRGEQALLVNMYGITETTVHVTYRPMSPADTGLSASPIGRAIPDLEIRLLDGDTMQPVATGEVGEIFVGGAGLARGYLNRPELTQARFVPHPWQEGARLYRSGDLARLNEAGEYEHLGRADQQIKIRGFRIELAEIETALLSHPDISLAAVLLRADTAGHDRLVGYVVCGRAERPSQVELKAHLARSLPEHMIPAAFVFLAGLPLTVNGKLDRAALPQPGRARPDSAAAYCMPRTALERRITEVVAGLLRIDAIGIDDNFFDLGADSLLMVEMHRRLRDEDAPNLGLIDLYRYPNVRALAGQLSVDRPRVLAGLAKAQERGARFRARADLRPRVPPGARHD